MNNTEIKDLMSQFDQSSLREFSYTNDGLQLVFSKNEHKAEAVVPIVSPVALPEAAEVSQVEVASATTCDVASEGTVIESPLVGVAYLSPSPDKATFVSVGDTVKKGQTVMIIEAMKVMNEIPAPCDGTVAEILVANEDVIEFGQGLVRIV
ncbi:MULTISPECIES: acetyl-CoA carboxylase biotin carboxyl carrier protein [unclassified Streptococcus]|uniref:acetyl-CoA carboxylase biotin carboxyl carrier protein n=1 Tax=unclassified Streptococcus TaxID=2608887 RepID=UPI001072A205|nr:MULTISPECIES: acetyl-CoA carboxylase biotin carboxyl carrier protein [unclassified Streptococcus]MBF0788141.1 acetyl-CoA carboxylase biotin carboxyl carrier protein [Streptococcus sp. 19428wC2_LYSM12]MCQ9211257.1 acetyl-CoA carboxylase biotin carboxyl carrier protein [Streptococcus sp. B01]MCQ9214570.1 acetyl-CoA carboxylase biotin carboxyl carrier protein [Streptococcus sp. O1]TFV04813.1 acetyl-CoA carboxylase biotin carboxyl carrier protein [Streptococcus sp. LYSM12]